MADEDRRSMALFPIGIVMKLTDLTARQIRYYEQQGLILPARTSGNQRMFSFNDVERLLEIKAMIEKGITIAGIKQVMLPTAEVDASEKPKEERTTEKLSRKQIHRLLKQELMQQRPGKASMIQGQLSRFFKL